MVYCTECGFANNDGDAFCTQCGTPLEHPDAGAAPSAAAAPDRTLVEPAAAPQRYAAPAPQAAAPAPGMVPAPPVVGAPAGPINGTTAPTVPAAAVPGAPVPPANGAPAQPQRKRSTAVIVILIALICVVSLVIGLFVTHSMGLWGANQSAQTTQTASGTDGQSKGGTSSKSKKQSESEADKTKDGEDKQDTKSEEAEETGPVITSSQLSEIADSYSSSDVAVSAVVIDDKVAKAKSSEDAVIATTAQSGKQFVAAGLYLPVYLAAMDSGNDDAKAQAATMMSTMDNASGNNAAAALGGWDAVNSWASSHGYSGTTFSRNYGDVAASNNGYENYSSSRDAALMLASVDAKGGTSLMNVDIASEGVTIPSGMTVHAHRGQGIQDTWNYFAIVEANGHKAAVAVTTQYQGKAVAAELMSKVLASVDTTLKQ
ncbi:zinc-ribbon domain-containing protein [Bifidobacterium miconisargentati]|uniref:zinc-ribbon domain-containing protein n=1 Tax=Bifidobacterium miconisargentati TaxID=2834437 RepID=UPI001BDD3E77|nr:serine hydrolase [Bifidobacterium miconisargentati]MBW3089283.1 serine hydrolase [Bifidobacterium miconisargentati]